MKKTYCEDCGAKLVQELLYSDFDPITGKKRIHRALACLNGRRSRMEVLFMKLMTLGKSDLHFEYFPHMHDREI